MEKYILIEWPEVQAYMEEDWFEKEAILSSESSAFFIPEKRYYEDVIDYIIVESERLATMLPTNSSEKTYIENEWKNKYPFEGGMSTYESILNLKFQLEKSEAQS